MQESSEDTTFEPQEAAAAPSGTLPCPTCRGWQISWQNKLAVQNTSFVTALFVQHKLCVAVTICVCLSASDQPCAKVLLVSSHQYSVRAWLEGSINRSREGISKAMAGQYSGHT